MSLTFGTSTFGTILFGGSGSSVKPIAVLGDTSDHGGTLVTTNQDDRFSVVGIPVCANGCEHYCPIPGHGRTAVTAITIKSFVNGKLIITRGARAECGAKIVPVNRGVYCE